MESDQCGEYPFRWSYRNEKEGFRYIILRNGTNYAQFGRTPMLDLRPLVGSYLVRKVSHVTYGAPFATKLFNL